MSKPISSPLFDEDFLNEQHPQDNTDLTGWNPNRRSSSSLPHPSEVQQTRFTDYAFPPIRRSTAIHTLSEDIASVPMLPEVSEEPFYREQRSMSYSFTTQDDAKLFNHHHLFLDTIMQEDEEDDDDQQQQDESKRTRSKSSAAVMDIWHPSLKEDDTKKWTMANNISGRRSSLIPPSLLDQEDDRFTGIRERMRRFSLAPSSTAFMENTNYQNQQQQQQQQHTLASSSFFMNQRRHSLAGPTNSTNYNNNNNQLPSLNQTSFSASSSNQQQDVISDLAVRERFSPPNDYLASSMILPQPSKSDIIKIDDMGKGTRLDSEILNDAIFYVVEFKGGRSDVFYSQQKTIKEYDLVIVEADRGRDIGKITMENISKQQLEIFYSQLKNNNNQNPTAEEKKKYLPNEIYVKCIFRQARSDEITLLMAKGQDEAKALMVCQSKIKQKKLNMQVVDAEYQWDRRKLTFYFVAEKRVDFRECAVNSIIQLK
ncbi:hypothetical protein INT46_001044 [Mucor plumbeus]|uniref:PSP1 C-terminal domain-containing protein n=1 Tax=Mucor plumbeus TaxID=97098 RepID=A0A8H7UZV4_9FUNG|nr:hypothetical protein INT46_001044 [Mucor plumbeus]